MLANFRWRPLVRDDRVPPRLLGPLSLVLLAAALAFHSLPLAWPTNRFDSGIGVVAAQRILRGDVPYVDFQTLYTPGAYYLTAAAFRVLGETFDVASRVGVATMALQAWLAWHVAARINGSRFTALVAFAAGLSFAYPYPALAVAFCALLVARHAVAKSDVRSAVAAGAVAGLAGWFRQDVGLAAAVAVGATLWTGTAGTASARAGRAAAAGLAAAATLALLLLPAIVRAPANLVDGLVVNPAATVAFRSHPDGAIAVFREGWIVAAVALCAGIGGVAGLAPAFRRPDASRALLVGASVLALWAFRYLCLRPDAHHVIPAAILAGVLGAAAMPRVGWLRLTVFVVCAAAVSAQFVRAAGARAMEAAGRRASGVVSMGDAVPGASSLYLPAADAEPYGRLIERVRALVAPGRPFLSACERHDRIHDQDLLLYFLTDRPAVPFDWHFDPGVTTREDVQRRLAADCERAGVRVVVRYDGPSHGEPTGRPDGSTFLDEWIGARFTRAETVGRYEIWVLR